VKPGQRWTANRKKAVLAQIAKGKLTVADACKLYATSEEELLEWRVIGVFASKTPKAIRKTKPRPRKSHAKYNVTKRTRRDAVPDAELRSQKSLHDTLLSRPVSHGG
jgi:hypothetical protein